jgi:hypothetical protein
MRRYLNPSFHSQLTHSGVFYKFLLEEILHHSVPFGQTWLSFAERASRKAHLLFVSLCHTPIIAISTLRRQAIAKLPVVIEEACRFDAPRSGEADIE